MRPIRTIALALLLWPITEIAAFIVVAGVFGLVGALVLLILVSAIGVLVLRRLGADAVTRLRTSPRGPGGFGVALDGAGTATAVGGILLTIPGFITGLLGALMVVPVSRRWLVATAGRLMASTPRKAGTGVIDLAPEEWRQVPDPELPPRRQRHEP